MSFRELSLIAIFVGVIFLFNCGPGKKVETEPQISPVPQEPTVEELRKPVSKDPTIYKAQEVIKEYGRFFKKYMPYEKYTQMTKGQAGMALDPDWFYDSYKLNLNENNYWMTVIFGTAKRAIERDPRIEKVLSDLPLKSITVELKTPSGKTYLLNDAEADGILDFVKDAKEKKVTKIDIELLDKMQEKYNWIIGLIKKHYKK